MHDAVFQVEENSSLGFLPAQSKGPLGLHILFICLGHLVVLNIWRSFNHWEDNITFHNSICSFTFSWKTIVLDTKCTILREMRTEPMYLATKC